MLKKENNVPFLVQITQSRKPVVSLSQALADKTQPWKLTTKGCLCEISDKEPLKGNFHNIQHHALRKKNRSLFCQESMTWREQLLCIRRFHYLL